MKKLASCWYRVETLMSGCFDEIDKVMPESSKYDVPKQCSHGNDSVFLQASGKD